MKYTVIQRDTGSIKYGHNYKDCKILAEVDDLQSAYQVAIKNGYMETEANFGGVHIFKEVFINASEKIES